MPHWKRVLLTSPLALFILWWVLLRPLQATPHWIKVSTPHFEMYTTNSEKQAANALRTFEEVRSFFLEASRSKIVPEELVRIIAFSSESEYKPYRLNGGAFAYYLRSRERDYIVMQDIQPEHYQAAVHEYTHLIVEHQHLTLPIWLNEGLADLYSSLEPRGKQAMVGRPLPGRVWEIQSQPWMDWNTLFAVKQNSPYYNERDKMSIFYAQSWALTHMLALDDRYRGSFPKFLAAVAGGTQPVSAFQSIYGKSMKQVDRDLQGYMRRSSVHVSLFDVNLHESALHPQVTQLTDLQTQLALGDLLSSSPRTAGEARVRLTNLSKTYPENSDVEESLGYLSWQQGNLTDAQNHFRLAIERHSQDAHMIYQYAEMRSSAGASPAEVISLLQRVLTIRPDDHDALFSLGLTAANARQFGVALSTLSQLKSIGPEEAYQYFSALAYCSMNLKGLAAARVDIERARPYAKSEAEKEQLNKMLEELDQTAKGSG